MKALQGFLPDFWDWQELVWVVGVTFTLHIGVLGILGTALVLIEHYGLFQDAKIQSQVRGPLIAAQQVASLTTHCFSQSNVKTHRDPTLRQCVSHLCVLHAIELLSLPVFYVVIKWREMPLEGALPPWYVEEISDPLLTFSHTTCTVELACSVEIRTLIIFDL